jgi:L-cysteine desulfidase
MADTAKKLYIDVIVETDKLCSRVVVSDEHTNVVLIEVDGKVVRSSKCNEDNTGCNDDREFLNIDSI